MTAHSLLFNAIVDRDPPAGQRAASPPAPMFSSRPSPALRTATYWEPEPGYSQYRTPPLPPLTRSPSTHSDSLSPPLDLNGLISMYATAESEPASPNPVFDPPYDNDWPPTSAHAYGPTTTAYQPGRGASNLKHTAMWHSPTSDEYPQWNAMLPDHGPHTHYPSSATTSSSASPSMYTSASSSSSYLLPGSTSSTPASTSLLGRPALPRTNTAPGGPSTSASGSTRPKKECFHCHVTSTPLWRREPSTQRPLCNACGLYLQQRNRLRPQELIDADIDDGEPEIPDSEYTGPKCSHCGTRQTSVWRRNKEGAQVCNACGVYMRLRGKERPLSLKRNKIKPRTKHPR